MSKRLSLICLVLSLATVATRAQQLSVLAPAGMFPPLEAYLESLRQQAGIPGMSVAVVQDGEIVWERGLGFQNIAARVRATPDTPYLVGDIGQTLAAALLLECVEERRLFLDDPVDRYGIILPGPRATLRNVMSHAALEGSEPFRYSPPRYAQLTLAMESCVPQPYPKTLVDRLLDRLAMKDSVPGTDLRTAVAAPEGLFEAEDLERYRAVLDRIAVPYKVEGRGRVEPTELLPEAVSTAAGLVSTVRDLARFDAALDSDLLLRDETRALAWSPANSPSGATLPAGLGWFVQNYRGERLVWQFGEIPNAYSSLILKLPARHLTFILLANSDGLNSPFQLQSGDITRSLFATLFLRLAI
ncbi:MAG: serine hydrolase domain-containing protein [Acidobacteriota bacterium]